MSDDPPRRLKRSRSAVRVRESLNAIGAELGARIPPPSPPSLGEGLLEQARNPRDNFAMSGGHTADANPEMRIMVALARIEERQNSLVAASAADRAAAEARHTNVMQAIATFVPRSEIEKDNRAIHSRIDGLGSRIDEVGDRIGTLEKRIWAALVSAVGALGTIILTKVGLLH